MSKVSSMEYMVLSDLVYLNFDKNRDGGNKTLYDIFYDEEYKAIKDEILKGNDGIRLRVEKGEDLIGEILKKWKVVAVKNNQEGTGFYGAAFQNIESEEVVIAYRGTEPTVTGQAERDLAYTDGKIAAGLIPEQVKEGNELYNYKELKTLKEAGAEISVTGHSLGGGIAQYVAGMNNLGGETFNGVGVAGAAKINGYEFFVDNIKMTEDGKWEKPPVVDEGVLLMLSDALFSNIGSDITNRMIQAGIINENKEVIIELEANEIVSEKEVNQNIAKLSEFLQKYYMDTVISDTSDILDINKKNELIIEAKKAVRNYFEMHKESIIWQFKFLNAIIKSEKKKCKKKA